MEILSLLIYYKMTQNIQVSDSLDHMPERCTVVAVYKKLVVGVAILSSPRETYITYLAVKAGWDNAGIARYVSSDSICIINLLDNVLTWCQIYAVPSHHAEPK
jgi:hypothetical protein